jgi:hypothetical protein
MMGPAMNRRRMACVVAVQPMEKGTLSPMALGGLGEVGLVVEPRR